MCHLHSNNRLLVIILVTCGMIGCSHSETPDVDYAASGEQSAQAVLHGSDAATVDAGEAVVAESPGGGDAATDVLAFHRSAIVIDTHNDVAIRLVDQPEFDFIKGASDGHTDLPRMQEGGLDAQFMSVWIKPRDFPGEKGWDRSMAMFDAIHKTVALSDGKIVFARTAAELRAAVAQGKVAMLIGVEGAHALGKFGSHDTAIDRLRRWYDRGARYLTLTWINSNDLAGSSGDRGKTRGLSELGRRAVREMNDLGMIVDVSHVSDPTVFDVIEVSRSPVLASHSGVRALHDHYRNLTDDMLTAIAKNDGAVCIVFHPGFLDRTWAAAQRKARKSGGEVKADPVKLSRLVDHIDHAVKVAGIDHVCLGSDFDGMRHTPAGLEDVSKFPALTEELVRRNYTEEEILKILGGNVLRVLEANERGAKSRPGG